MRAVTAKTAVHEIGHVFDLGEEDDRGGEIYSGSGADQTKEAVRETLKPGNPEVERWSVMSRGINSENFLYPTNTDYTAFSIEEWTSITRGRLDP